MKCSSTQQLVRVCSLLLLLAVSGCDERILHDLSEVHANRIKVKLAQANIDAQKVREGTLWSISVSSADATSALATLDKARVLKPLHLPSPLGSSSLIQTREERAHLLERSLARNLEQTLERMPHVLEARVHLHFQPENRLELIPKQTDHSASVVLVTFRPDGIDHADISRFVSGASGVQEQFVSVLVVPANPTDHPDAEKSPASPSVQPEVSAVLQFDSNDPVEQDSTKPYSPEPEKNSGKILQALPVDWKSIGSISLYLFPILLGVAYLVCRTKRSQKNFEERARKKENVRVLTPVLNDD